MTKKNLIVLVLIVVVFLVLASAVVFAGPPAPPPAKGLCVDAPIGGNIRQLTCGNQQQPDRGARCSITYSDNDFSEGLTDGDTLAAPPNIDRCPPGIVKIACRVFEIAPCPK